MSTQLAVYSKICQARFLSLDHGLPNEGFNQKQPNVLGKIRPATGKILRISRWLRTGESLFIMTCLSGMIQ